MGERKSGKSITRSVDADALLSLTTYLVQPRSNSMSQGMSVRLKRHPVHTCPASELLFSFLGVLTFVNTKNLGNAQETQQAKDRNKTEIQILGLLEIPHGHFMKAPKTLPVTSSPFWHV